MAVAYFQVDLSVRPAGDGGAAFVIPKVLQTQNYQFVLVKEGGAEGVVEIEASAAEIKKVDADKKCKKVSKKQAEKIIKDYPAPRLKKKYRQSIEAGKTKTAVEHLTEPFEIDKNGKRTIDTFQTVRSDFYLIDIPVILKPKR